MYYSDISDITGKLRDPDPEYRNCLVFREKLYGDLKKNLLALVKRVFQQFQSELILSNIPDDQILTHCHSFGRKDHIGCTPDFSNWKEQNGCWVLARHFNKNIPKNGDITQVDPSALLSLVCHCKLFTPRCGHPHELASSAHIVRRLRNSCYGHIPDLKITIKVIQKTRESSFDKIIERLNELSQII